MAPSVQVYLFRYQNRDPSKVRANIQAIARLRGEPVEGTGMSVPPGSVDELGVLRHQRDAATQRPQGQDSTSVIGVRVQASCSTVQEVNPPMPTLLKTRDVEKASALLREREQVIATKWDRLIKMPRSDPYFGQRDVTICSDEGEPFDDELAFAVEEFRGRKIAAINAELRALGIDPSKE